MVSGPAGMRCPECASLRGTHLYKAAPQHLLILGVIGVIAGAIGVTVVNLVPFLFFVIFLSTVYGGAAGELMLRAIGRKHGSAVELVGIGSFVVGGMLPLAQEVVVFHSPTILATRWLSLLALGIAASACYGRLKY